MCCMHVGAGVCVHEMFVVGVGGHTGLGMRGTQGIVGGQSHQAGVGRLWRSL